MLTYKTDSRKDEMLLTLYKTKEEQATNQAEVPHGQAGLAGFKDWY